MGRLSALLKNGAGTAGTDGGAPRTGKRQTGDLQLPEMIIIIINSIEKTERRLVEENMNQLPVVHAVLMRYRRCLHSCSSAGFPA